MGAAALATVTLLIGSSFVDLRSSVSKCGLYGLLPIEIASDGVTLKCVIGCAFPKICFKVVQIC